MHGGLGEEAVISCIVHGDPVPSVRWYRETMVLARYNLLSTGEAGLIISPLL